MSRRVLLAIVMCSAAIVLYQFSRARFGLAEDGPLPKKNVLEDARGEPKPDSELISIEAANRFHAALLFRAILQMPADLHLRLAYGGIIGYDEGFQPGARGGGFGDPLRWSVVRHPFKVFSVAISTHRSPETVVACKIGKDTVFVSVTWIGIGEKITPMALKKQRVELGDRSILDFLKLLETPAGEPEGVADDAEETAGKPEKAQPR